MGIFSIDETIIDFSGKQVWEMLNEKQKEEITNLILSNEQNNILTKLSNICRDNHICDNCCLHGVCEYLSIDMSDFVNVIIHNFKNSCQ